MGLHSEATMTQDVVFVGTCVFAIVFFVLWQMSRDAVKSCRKNLAETRLALTQLRNEREALRSEVSRRDSQASALQREVRHREHPSTEEVARIIGGARQILEHGPCLQRVKVVSTLDLDLDIFSTNKSLTDFLDAQGAHFAVVPDTVPDAVMPWVLLAKVRDGWAATHPGIHTFLYDKDGNGLMVGTADRFVQPDRPMRRRHSGLGRPRRVMPGGENG